MQSNLKIENASLADIPALTALLDSLFAIEVDFSADTEKQKNLLLKAIDDWRGQHEQVDDILVIGSRYV